MPTTVEQRLERRRQKRCARSNSNWIAGASLVALGTLLFLDNLGVLSGRSVWDAFWPGLLLAFGLWRFSCNRRPSDRVVGLIATVFGAAFLLNTFGVLHFRTREDSWALAILLIVAGTVAMQKALDRGGPPNRIRPGLSTLPPGERVNENPEADAYSPGSSSTPLPIYLDDWVLGATKKRRIESGDFRGGEIHCVLGEMHIDLRNVYQPRPELPMVIEAHAVLGAIKLRVPQDWQIQMDGSAIFGAFQDKTIPMQNVNGKQPTLIVSGGAFFAEVSILS